MKLSVNFCLIPSCGSVAGVLKGVLEGGGENSQHFSLIIMASASIYEQKGGERGLQKGV